MLFAFIATALLIVPIGLAAETHEETNTLRVLKRDTNALSVLLTDTLNHGEQTRAQQLVHSYSLTTGREVLVVDANGVVLASRAKLTQDPYLLSIARTVTRKGSSGISPASAQLGSQYYVALRLRRV